MRPGWSHSSPVGRGASAASPGSARGCPAVSWSANNDVCPFFAWTLRLGSRKQEAQCQRWEPIPSTSLPTAVPLRNSFYGPAQGLPGGLGRGGCSRKGDPAPLWAWLCPRPVELEPSGRPLSGQAEGVMTAESGFSSLQQPARPSRPFGTTVESPEYLVCTSGSALPPPGHNPLPGPPPAFSPSPPQNASS